MARNNSLNSWASWAVVAALVSIVLIWVRTMDSSASDMSRIIAAGDPIRHLVGEGVADDDFAAAVDRVSERLDHTRPPEQPTIPNGNLSAYVATDDPEWLRFPRGDHRLVDRVQRGSNLLKADYFYRDSVLNPRDLYIGPARRKEIARMVEAFKKDMAPIEKLLFDIAAKKAAEIVAEGGAVPASELGSVVLSEREQQIADYKARAIFKIKRKHAEEVRARGGILAPTSKVSYERELEAQETKMRQKKLFGTSRTFTVQHGVGADGRPRRSVVSPRQLDARMGPQMEQAAFLRSTFFMHVLEYYRESGALHDAEIQDLLVKLSNTFRPK